MRATSLLPGRGSTDVDDALHLHVNQKSDCDDDDDAICVILTKIKIWPYGVLPISY